MSLFLTIIKELKRLVITISLQFLQTTIVERTLNQMCFPQHINLSI